MDCLNPGRMLSAKRLVRKAVWTLDSISFTHQVLPGRYQCLVGTLCVGIRWGLIFPEGNLCGKLFDLSYGFDLKYS